MEINQPVAKFYEEVSAKIPALTLLTNLGYKFTPPSDIEPMRISQSSVVLVRMLRQVLKTKTFDFQGRQHPLSEAAIDKIIHELANLAMNKGLKAANEKLYNALTYGVGLQNSLTVKRLVQRFR